MRSLVLAAAALVALAAAAAVVLRPDPDGVPDEVAGPADADPVGLVRDAEARFDRGAMDEALALLERAAAQFRADSNTAGLAAVAATAARMHAGHGQSEPARERFAEAVRLYEAAGDVEAQARALAAWGDLERGTFQWQRAAELYRRARAFWADLPEPPTEGGHAALLFDPVSSAPHGEDAARQILAEAEEIFHAVEDAEALAEVSLAAARLELTMGHTPAATQRLEEARQRFEAARSDFGRAAVDLMAARVDMTLGFNRDADVLLAQAEQVLAAMNDAAGLAHVAETRGDLARLQGHAASGVRLYQQAAGAFRALGDSRELDAMRKLAVLAEHAGGAAVARTAYEQLAERATELSAPSLAAIGAAGAAQAALAGGGPAAALAALPHSVGGLSHEAAARVLLARGDAAAANGSTDAAVDAYAAAAERFAAARLPFGTLLARLGTAEAEGAAGRTEPAQAARDAATAAFADLQSLHGEANRFLGLPAAEVLSVRDVRPESIMVAPEGAHEPIEVEDPEALAANAADEAENLRQFPDQMVEARAAVDDVRERLAAI